MIDSNPVVDGAVFHSACLSHNEDRISSQKLLPSDIGRIRNEFIYNFITISSLFSFDLFILVFFESFQFFPCATTITNEKTRASEKNKEK